MIDFNNIVEPDEHFYNVVRASLLKSHIEKHPGWVFTEARDFMIVSYKLNRMYVTFKYDIENNVINVLNVGFCDNTALSSYKFNAYFYNEILKLFNSVCEHIGCSVSYQFDSLFYVVDSTYDFRCFEEILSKGNIRNICLYFTDLGENCSNIERLQKHCKNTEKNIVVVYNESYLWKHPNPKDFGREIHTNTICSKMKFANDKLFMKHVVYMLKFNHYTAVHVWNDKSKNTNNKQHGRRCK